MGEQNKNPHLLCTSRLRGLLSLEHGQEPPSYSTAPLSRLEYLPLRRDVIISRRQERAGFPAASRGSRVSDGFCEN